jgi:SAM-dependent methyltransferase
MAPLPPPVHLLSFWLVRAIAATPAGRGVVEAALRSYYPLARSRGLANLAIPLWYRWLRTYYFATLRKRMSNTDFQRKYWELGSLTDYRRYVVAEADDRRIVRFLDEIAARARSAATRAHGRRVQVLEIGCGDGLPLRALRDALDGTVPMSLFGVDISMHGLLLGRDAVAQAHLIQASVTQLPFSGRFDLGFGRGVLMFLDGKEVAEAFSELARSCRTFVLTEPATVRGGEPVDIGRLTISLERADIDQTSWIHPYPRFVEFAGGTVVAEEYVSGNYLMVAEWRAEPDATRTPTPPGDRV